MAVERKPGEHDQLGRVVAGAQNRGATEQIALETAHQKAVEQSRHQRVLQVQVHPIGIYLLRIAEHHGLQLRFLAPLPELLAGLAWRSRQAFASRGPLIQLGSSQLPTKARENRIWPVSRPLEVAAVASRVRGGMGGGRLLLLVLTRLELSPQRRCRASDLIRQHIAGL